MASETMLCGSSTAICCDEAHPTVQAPPWDSKAFANMLADQACSGCVQPTFMEECQECEEAAADHSMGKVDCHDQAACTAACDFALPPIPEMDDASFQQLLACCCCPPSPPSFPCGWRDCDLTFASHADLSIHVNQAHLGLPDLSATTSSRSSPVPATPILQHSIPSRCKWDDCQMDIEVPAIGNANAILFDHLLRHHLTGPPDPSLTLPSPSLLSETFDTPTLLPAQSTSQSGDHQCRWTDCGESFGSSATLMAHVTETHVGSGKATYICEWEDCPRAIEGRVFSQRQKVLRHIQTHTGDKPHICSICSKAFAEATTLAQHHRTHTKERPYSCTECGKAFALASALTIHMRTHTGDKPFKCPEPGCKAAFAESSNLRKHVRIHSGDRPFRCAHDGCGKAFQRSDQLARHMKVHNSPVG